MGKLDLTKPEYFYNRELSWLKFNLRVLKEAMVKDTPAGAPEVYRHFGL